VYNSCVEYFLAAWRGATGLSATSPANALIQRFSGFPLLSLAEVQSPYKRMVRNNYMEKRSMFLFASFYYSLVFELIFEAQQFYIYNEPQRGSMLVAPGFNLGIKG
jgi:hypothetical protein